MFNLSPKNDKFFDMFISFSEVIDEIAVNLESFVENPANMKENYKVLKEIEHKGDKLVHELLEELNNSFITPLDREDIYLITKSLDDVVDDVEEIGNSYFMYNLTDYNEKAVMFSKLISKSAAEIKELMVALKDMKKFDRIKEKIVEINKIENEGDAAFVKAMRELFTSDEKEVQIIIWKDIYEKFEKTIDCCERLANIIQGVVMKHA